MSEWRGLHNPGRHEPYFEMTGSADCMYGECGESCTAENPCRCCLRIEVEALRAQVQAVRKACRIDSFAVDDTYRLGYATAQKTILRALDGDTDD